MVSHWQDLAKANSTAKSSNLNFHRGVPHGCITLLLYIVGNVRFQNGFLASPSDMKLRTDSPLYISQLGAPDFSPSLKMAPRYLKSSNLALYFFFKSFSMVCYWALLFLNSQTNPICSERAHHMIAYAQTNTKSLISGLKVLLNRTIESKLTFLHIMDHVPWMFTQQQTGEDNSGQEKKCSGWGGQKDNTKEQLPQISSDTISQYMQ